MTLNDTIIVLNMSIIVFFCPKSIEIPYEPYLRKYVLLGFYVFLRVFRHFSVLYVYL